jgi:hypothetical protein
MDGRFCSSLLRSLGVIGQRPYTRSESQEGGQAVPGGAVGEVQDPL